MQDVVVVGAGPSGAHCAYLLAKAGFGVLLLEKERLPRYKPCSGGLTPKAVALLDFPIHRIVQRRCGTALCSLRFNEGRRVPLGVAEIAMVDRREFDHFLAQQAVEHGVELREETRVIGVSEERNHVEAIAENGRFRARFLVAADGAPSTVARALGIHRRQRCHVGINAEASFDGVNDRSFGHAGADGIIYDFGWMPWGHGWVFPKEGHGSVGVFTNRRRAASLRDYLARYTDRLGLSRRGRLRNVEGHFLPVGGRADRFHSRRALLIGDAASAVDPFSGEGISHAIRTSQIAARWLRCALRACAPRALAQYTRQVNHEIHAELRWARYFSYVFYTFPTVGYHMVVSREFFVDIYRRVIAGQCSYRKLVLPFLQESRPPAFQPPC